MPVLLIILFALHVAYRAREFLQRPGDGTTVHLALSLIMAGLVTIGALENPRI